MPSIDMIGRTLGHYRVVEKIGAGAMGDVYRAHDERLDRDVALKLLPAGTLADEASRRRFRQEALVLSRLNHPNIETVFDFDTHDGIDFLVMEYVPGVTLSHRLAERPMTDRDTLKIGVQLAMALEEAHEKGVVHRDLKPANVAVTPRGQVKVLDFGLADLLATGEPSQASTKTVSGPAGTLRYMAPEVLQGNAADPRSDIWSLGVVLYEMACGTAPFQGSTTYELTMAIVGNDPPALPAHVAPSLRTVIGRCLAKAPEQRYQRAGEVHASLEALLSDSSPATVTVRPDATRPRWPLQMVAGLAVVAATVLGVAWLMRRAPTPLPDTRFADAQLNLLLSTEGVIASPHLSQDGKNIVYVSLEGGRFDLYVGRVGGGGRVRVTSDGETKLSPTFSPDGERIAYTRLPTGSQVGEICVRPAFGGDATPLVAGMAPAWSPDGKKLAYLMTTPGEPMALSTVAVDGSDQRVILRADAVYPFLRDPAWSPDGRTLAVVRSWGGVAGEIWLVPATGGPARQLSHDPPIVFSHEPAFTPDGRGIVHSSNRGGATNLWLAPTDGSPPVRLTSGPGPDEHPSVASDNTVAFLCSRWRHEIRVLPVGGGEPRVVATHAQYLWAPTFSRDGRQLSYSQFENDGLWHIWTVPVEGGAARQLTTGAEGEIYSRFAPDGSVIFHSWKARSILSVPPSGGVTRTLTSGPQDEYGDVSPDGRQLAFARTEGDVTHVYVAPMIGGQPRLLTSSRATLPRWSPDGTRILFCRDRTVRSGISVIGADGKGERPVVASGGWPVWWPDGKRFLYLRIASDGTQQLWTSAVEGQDSHVESWVHWNQDNCPVDVSLDGRLLATSDGRHQTDEIWLLHPRTASRGQK